MSNYNKKVGLGIICLLVIVGVVVSVQSYKNSINNGSSIKIGIVTPLTGAVAYWGESSMMGVELAKRDLAKEGIKAEFILEDVQLDPKIALNAVQKLVNVDKVTAVYSEFNPAAIAVASFVKDKNILNIYDAAPISPLKDSANIYKSYIDYETSCRQVAQLIKNRGIERVGVLKLNLEFGDLCLKGIKEVYGESVFAEDYNAGNSDFRASLLKLKTKNIQALFNISFQPETLASIKQAGALDMKETFVGLSEIVSPDVAQEYSKILEGSVMFGLPNISDDFINRIKTEFPGQSVGNYQALTLAYIHSLQIARALDKCNDDMICVRKEINNSKPETVIGFSGFKNHVAGFTPLIQEWKDGAFVEISKE